MDEGEVIPVADQESRDCPLVEHVFRIVQFRVGVGVKELDHPCFHPACCRPCPGF